MPINWRTKKINYGIFTSYIIVLYNYENESKKWMAHKYVEQKKPDFKKNIYYFIHIKFKHR